MPTRTEEAREKTRLPRAEIKIQRARTERTERETRRDKSIGRGTSSRAALVDVPMQ